MISFGNAASSQSALIPLKTSHKKREELLRAIMSKKNFINLHSAAFVTVFARNLVHAYKFRIFQKRSHRNCSNFAIVEEIMAGTYSLKRFLKKKLLVQRNKKINKKRNGVVTLPWRLRLR